MINWKEVITKILKVKIILLMNFVFFGFFFQSKALANEEISNPLSNYIRNKPKDSFYILGKGDVLYITVNQNTNSLNTSFTINGEGVANLKELKNIYVAGLTVEELTRVLNEEYSNIVKSPDVEITVLKHRPIKIYIDGEVEEPGIHNLPGTYRINTKNNSNESSAFFKNRVLFNGIKSRDPSEFTLNSSISEGVFFPTLFDAIRKSGGVSLNADLSKIKIIRKNSLSNGGGKITTNVNLLETINLKDNSQNIRLLDGDNIIISKSNTPSIEQLTKAIKSNLNPRFISVYVAGRVENAGVIQLSKSAVMSDAIDLVGAKVIRGPVKFIRYNGDGSVVSRKFKYNKKAQRGSKINPTLKNGDIIYITKSLINVSNEVITEITSPFQGILSTYTLYKAFSDL